MLFLLYFTLKGKKQLPKPETLKKVMEKLEDMLNMVDDEQESKF